MSVTCSISKLFSVCNLGEAEESAKPVLDLKLFLANGWSRLVSLMPGEGNLGLREGEDLDLR